MGHIKFVTIICFITNTVFVLSFCPAKWEQFESKCLHFSKSKVVFAENVRLCKEIGAEMVTINSAEENKFIRSMINSNQYWLGLPRIGDTYRGPTRRLPNRRFEVDRDVAEAAEALKEFGVPKPQRSSVLDSIRDWLNGNRDNRSSTAKTEYKNWDVGYPSRVSPGQYQRCAYINGVNGKWKDVLCVQEKYAMCQLTEASFMKNVAQRMDSQIDSLKTKVALIENDLEMLTKSSIAAEGKNEKKYKTWLSALRNEMFLEIDNDAKSSSDRMDKIENVFSEKLEMLKEYTWKQLNEQLEQQNTASSEKLALQSKRFDEKLNSTANEILAEVEQIRNGDVALAIQFDTLQLTSNQMAQSIDFINQTFEKSTRNIEAKLSGGLVELKNEMNEMGLKIESNTTRTVESINTKLHTHTTEMEKSFEKIDTMSSEMSQLISREAEIRSEFLELQKVVNTTSEKHDNFASAFSLIHKSMIETVNIMSKEIEKTNSEFRSIKESVATQRQETMELKLKLKSMDDDFDNRVLLAMKKSTEAPNTQ